MALYKVKGRWYVKTMHKGEMYHLHRGFDKKEDALMALSVLKAKFKKSSPVTQHATFLSLWEQYLDHCQAFNSKEWYDAKRYIAYRYFVKWFNKEISSIGSAEIEKHLIERRSLSARSANLDFEILRSFFNWCVRMELLDKSPCRPLHKFPREKKIKPIPTKKDVEELIDCNEGVDKLLILLLVYTMGRYSEIRRLKWEDVDFNSRVLYLRTRKTKDGSEKIREIPINGLLLDTLLALRRESGYVLFNAKKSNGEKPYRDLRKRLTKCFSMAGLSLPSKFHQFRHYGATRLADKGTPLNVIQDILGHTTLNTTNLYLQSLRESKRRAIEKL